MSIRLIYGKIALFMATPICSTNFMKESLKSFTKEQTYVWFEECKKLDKVLNGSIVKNLDKFTENESCLPEEFKSEFETLLKNSNVNSEYDLSNIEAFHGYTVYGFPDNGKIALESKNADLYYGIAKAEVFGVTHTHELSDAFNYILEGEGVFTGSQKDEGKFNFYYHGQSMVKDSSFEIPKGMTHGHLVKEGKDLWIFFIQECGFKRKLKCVGDFHVIDGYDKAQFGPYYI